MSGVPYHAYTHRPKAEGGTDPIEGEGAWIVLKDIATGQAFTADSTTTIIYQEVVNSYGSTFDTVLFGAGPSFQGVEVLVDGLYSVHLSVPLDELTVAEHTIDLVNADPVAGPRFHRTTACLAQSATGPAVSGADAAEWTIRLAAGEKIHFLWVNPTPATTYNSRSDGGAYMEVRKLATTEGLAGRVRDIAT